ncbi:metallophosphoesterase family protein [Peribacillus sp. NPDC097264]|uniref:metallophosphoesterase family protein n=1 Tax=Peribacillus sp. NPDC097264 TaxID=3390616 RepID=UPI003D07732E
MKVAIMTDIHGNASALKAVLKEIDDRNEVERIYCLGDMIAIGPDTNDVLDLLFSRDDLTMISGNHDEAVLAIVKGEEHPTGHVHVKEHHEWIAKRMDPLFVPLLEKLPRTLEVPVHDRTLFFTHYHMEKEKRNAHISENPFSKIVEPNLANLEALFRNRSEDLIGFGHHHPLHHFQNDQTIFLNPGSLGCNSEPIARYAVVTIEDNGIQVHLGNASYDNAAFLSSYKKLQVPEHEFIIRAFHGNQMI